MSKKVDHKDSPTWPHVLAFAERMEAKLAKNRHKGDREAWLKDNPRDLFDRIRQEMIELAVEMDTERAYREAYSDFRAHEVAEKIANEAADVANFAMMVADGYLSRALARRV
jgi:NTP pyrophosphatase (non-canonical NTP hydrolase)